MGVSICFVQWKFLNMLKTSHQTKRTSPYTELIQRIRQEHETDTKGYKQIQQFFLSVTHTIAWLNVLL